MARKQNFKVVYEYSGSDPNALSDCILMALADIAARKAREAAEAQAGKGGDSNGK